MTVGQIATNGRPDFAAAVAKVERANHHISDFATQVRRFFDGYPYNVMQEADQETQRFGYHLYERRRFPDRRFALIIGDALHNLRSALDYLISACSRANGASQDRSQFPFAGEEKKLADAIDRHVTKAGAGEIAAGLVRRLKPYPGGNDSLIALHALDNIDKHRLVLPLACKIEVTVTAGLYEGLPESSATGSIYSPEGTSAFIAAQDGYEDAIAHDFSYTGDVVFYKDSMLPNQPCVEALYELSACVADVIEAFESEFESIPLSFYISRTGRLIEG